MQMNRSDREIGKVIRVKTYNAQVELSKAALSYTKSSDGGLYKIGVINSYVILPVGSERVVGVVTSLDMLEEAESNYEKLKMLILPTSRRTMWISMIGTITQNPITNSKKFEYGIRQYPELNNSVWHASKDDLDIIFEKEVKEEDRKNKLISIGKSPLFPDYDIKLNVDEFFGKHAAILGNTGSGKSCTVTAIIDSVMNHPNGNDMPNAHFIIFDTNSEYEKAFSEYDDKGKVEKRRYNRLVISNEGDEPTGFWMPHWFMNGRDHDAFFRPGEGAQGPLLHRSIVNAKVRNSSFSQRTHFLELLESSINGIQGLVEDPPTGNQAGFGRRNLRQQVEDLLEVIDRYEDSSEDLGLEESFDFYRDSVTEMLDASQGDRFAQITANVIDRILSEVEEIRIQITDDRNDEVETGNGLIGIDTPTHYNFNELIDTFFPQEVAREARSNPTVRNWVSSLIMRLNRFRNDPRYQFLFQVEPIEKSLETFLSYILGISPNRYQDGKEKPWDEHYEDQYPEYPEQHNVTILDFSELASDVLENITALIARLILEFIQKINPRGSYPVVLVLEEAHHYIPSHANLERQVRAREVFERIAKEGRKYGLSLLVASQRPSELSRTVLAQCNSFIVHRIQNPDDKDYFKSVISSIDRDLLDQLPILPQQQALVLGDCVTVPLQVKINDVDPKPDSDDPEFFNIWSDPETNIPDLNKICSNWEMSDDYNTEDDD